MTEDRHMTREDLREGLAGVYTRIDQSEERITEQVHDVMNQVRLLNGSVAGAHLKLGQQEVSIRHNLDRTEVLGKRSHDQANDILKVNFGLTEQRNDVRKLEASIPNMVTMLREEWRGAVSDLKTSVEALDKTIKDMEPSKMGSRRSLTVWDLTLALATVTATVAVLKFFHVGGM